MKMYHTAFQILKHQMEAENAVQEAFVSIAKNYKKYACLSGSKVTGLCITAVKNKCIDAIRRQRHLSEENLEDLVLYNTDTDYEPETYVECREQREMVRRLLTRLPEVYCQVLVLKYYYDYNNQEIAKQLRISKKTAEVRLYRAKKKMRELLENEGYEGN